MDGVTCTNCGYSSVFYCGSLDVVWRSQIPVPIEETFASDETDVIQKKLEYQLSKLHPATRKKFTPQLRGRRVLASECNSILIHCDHCNLLHTTPILLVQFDDGYLRISADRCGKCHRRRYEITEENVQDITCPSCGHKSLEESFVIY